MYFNQKSILAADYLRLSREDGDKLESDSIRNQRSLITDFVKQHKEIQLVEEYIDDGYSGTNFDRPAFQRMLEDVKRKKINCIIVKDLSRLGRNYIETGRYLEKIFPYMGVRFIAITDHYDSAAESDDADQIIVPFKNLINDAYCRDISIKIRSQLDVKRKNGQFIGSFAAYGYLKDPEDKNHLIVDAYAADIVRLIFNLKIDGYSSQRIATRLNEMGVLPPLEYKRSRGMNYNSGFRSGSNPKWAVTSINRILTNELYIGTMVQGKNRKINYKVKKSSPIEKENWIRVENTHEAIIPEETFQYVQNLLELDTRIAPKKKSVYLFSGFLRCGDCGQNMVKRSTTKNGKKYCYYHCSTYKNKEGCSSHLISEQLVYDVVLDSVKKQIALLVEAEKIIRKNGMDTYKKVESRSLEKQLMALYEEVERYKDLKTRLYQDMVDGIVSREEYHEYNQRFTEKMQKAEKAKEESEKKMQELSAKEKRLHPWIEDFKKYKNIQSLDRKAVVTLIEQIVVYSKEQIEIQFKYNLLKILVMDQIQNLIKSMCDRKLLLQKMKNETKENDIFYEAAVKVRMLERKIAQAEERNVGLYEDYVAGIVEKDDFDMMKERYIQKLQNLREEIQTEKQNQRMIEKRVNRYMDMVNHLEKYLDKREYNDALVQELVEYVEVFTDGSIHVCFKCKDDFQQITKKMEGVQNG